MRRRHIYIDCTQTLVSGLNTGVQRVVRKVIGQMREVSAGDANFQVVPVVVMGGGIFTVSDQLIASGESTAFSNGGPDRGLVVTWQRMLQWARRSFGDLAGRWFGAWARRGYFQLRALHLRSALNKPAVFAAGDILLMLDICTDLSLDRPLRAARQAGVRIVFCHYDLIAITHAHLCHASWVEAFRDYFYASTKYADAYLAISRAMRDELVETLSREFPQTCEGIRCESFRLGSDLVEQSGPALSGPQNAGSKSVSNDLSRFFQEHRQVLLMVGTLEPRKNHQLSLAVFKRLAKSYPNLGLLWIGRPGWRSDDLIGELHAASEFSKRMLWFSSASDQDLQYAYGHAAVLLFPSLAEGFGLPVVEATALGCRVLASDIACHRELIGAGIRLLSLEDPSLWECAVREILDGGADTTQTLAPATQALQLPTWRQSAESVLNQLENLDQWPTVGSLAADQSRRT